jgi:hypothetical protein
MEQRETRSLQSWAKDQSSGREQVHCLYRGLMVSVDRNIEDAIIIVTPYMAPVDPMMRHINAGIDRRTAAKASGFSGSDRKSWTT